MEIPGSFRGLCPLGPHQFFALDPLGGLEHPRTQAETEFLEDLLFYFIILFYFIRLSFEKIYCFIL